MFSILNAHFSQVSIMCIILKLSVPTNANHINCYMFNLQIYPIFQNNLSSFLESPICLCIYCPITHNEFMQHGDSDTIICIHIFSFEYCD